jgi:hypothetical protein
MVATALKALLAAIDQAWEAGCPIAGPAAREHLASSALRQWHSFHRRARERSPSDNARIEDLAKGLRDALEPEASLVGQLMEDYRYLAGVLAPVLKNVAHE